MTMLNLDEVVRRLRDVTFGTCEVKCEFCEACIFEENCVREREYCTTIIKLAAKNEALSSELTEKINKLIDYEELEAVLRHANGKLEMFKKCLPEQEYENILHGVTRHGENE